MPCRLNCLCPILRKRTPLASSSKRYGVGVVLALALTVALGLALALGLTLAPGDAVGYGFSPLARLSRISRMFFFISSRSSSRYFRPRGTESGWSLIELGKFRWSVSLVVFVLAVGAEVGLPVAPLGCSSLLVCALARDKESAVLIANMMSFIFSSLSLLNSKTFAANIYWSHGKGVTV